MKNELYKLSKKIIASRLILRKPNLLDAQDMFAYLSNSNNVYWTTIVPHQNLQSTVKAINDYFLINPDGKYVIEHKALKRVIGAIDVRFKTTYYDIGYILSEEFHNQGLISEAMQALLANLQKTTLIDMVNLFIDCDNHPSNQVARKLNFCLKNQQVIFNQKLNTKRVVNVYNLNIRRK